MSESRSEQVVESELRENIEVIVARYESRAYALYELLVPGAEGAAESLAQAFSRALACFHKGSENVPFEAVVYREVIQSAIALMEDWGGCVAEEENFGPSILPAAATRKVDSAVHSLPMEYRIVFSLRDVLRVPSELVQEILSVTELEIRAYLHRARLMLFRVMREAHS